jgi:hypothetical protein
LVFKLGSDEKNEEILKELKSIKSKLIDFYQLINNHLISLETINNTNELLFSKEIIDSFNSTKEKTISILKQFNFESISKQINELSIVD